MQYKEISVADVEVISNYRQVLPPSEKSKDVLELAESISKHGVKQPVLVRVHPKSLGKFQLIFGHRRLIASKVAGKQLIPANIDNVADDDILELQVTENLQRVNPHPMDEAVAYKSLIDAKKYSTAELAARFGKSEDYILTRLKLNDLVPDLQLEFKKEKMLLGHALLLARLQPADQKEAKKQASGGSFLNESVSEVEDWIERAVINKLSNAPFDLKDAKLVPSAGACTVCPKRSGAGNLLFADVKENDRCFDKKCFQSKCAVAFKVKVKEIVETQPDVVLLRNHYEKLDPEINNYLQSLKIKVLKDIEDFRSHQYDKSFAVKAKGFWLNGNYDKGKIVTVYLKGKAATGPEGKASGASLQENPKEMIAGIQQRTKRAAELDEEKVQGKVVDAIEASKHFTEIESKLKTLPLPDHAAMMHMVFHELDWKDKDEVVKKLQLKGYHGGTSKQNSEAWYNSLRELSVGEMAYIIRKAWMNKHTGSNQFQDTGYITRKLAESFTDVDVKAIDAEQAKIRTDREGRALERINALKAKVKPVKKVPAKPVKKK